MCKKYGVGRGKAAAQLILTQPAKFELLPLLLPLLLPPLLLLMPLLTSKMATLGLTQRLQSLGPAVSGQAPPVSGQAPPVSGQAPPVSGQAPPLPLPPLSGATSTCRGLPQHVGGLPDMSGACLTCRMSVTWVGCL